MFETAPVSALLRHRPNATVIELALNRIKKFERDFPTAKAMDKELISIYNRTRARVKDDDLKAMALQRDYSVKRYLTAIDPSKVDDPAIKEAHKLLKDGMGQAATNTLALISECPFSIWGHNKLIIPQNTINPFKGYPLFDVDKLNGYRASKDSKEHMYIYLNAAYAARQEA